MNRLRSSFQPFARETAYRRGYESPDGKNPFSHDSWPEEIWEAFQRGYRNACEDRAEEARLAEPNEDDECDDTVNPAHQSFDEWLESRPKGDGYTD